MIRMALLFFLSAVLLLIICSLTLVLSWFFHPATVVAAAFFRLGLLSMLCGVISAILELRESLEQVEFEGHFVFHAVEPSLADLRQETIE